MTTDTVHALAAENAALRAAIDAALAQPSPVTTAAAALLEATVAHDKAIDRVNSLLLSMASASEGYAAEDDMAEAARAFRLAVDAYRAALDAAK